MVVLANGHAAGSQLGLDEPLLFLDWNPQTRHAMFPWTFRHAFEGVQVFGATGSGKTTGPGRTIALAFLTARYAGKHPFGGLVLTAKPDELDLWANPNPDNPADAGYCSIAGRQSDLIIIGDDVEKYRSFGVATPDFGHSFNFLQYELGTYGGLGGRWTQNLVTLFYTAIESGMRRGESSNESYWEDALRQLLANTIDLVRFAKDKLSLQDLAQVILTAPQSQADAYSPVWQRTSFCWACLREAVDKLRDTRSKETDAVAAYHLDEQLEDLRQTVNYWLLDFAGLAQRTRSIIVNSFTSKALSLLRSPMRRLFSSDCSTFMPEDTWRGKILVLDLPVKEHGEAGRFAQVLLKTVWQRATERRNLAKYPNPVFLWADESQCFVTAEDMQFQQTARSKRAATVLLSQNLANYYAVLGGRNGQAATDSLLGNLQTTLLCSQGDPTTNEWSERLFGKELKTLKNKGFGGQGVHLGRSETFAPAFPTDEFARLKKGGDGTVEGVVFIPSYAWVRDGRRRPGILVQFDQNLLRPTGGSTGRSA
jgi:hypothetical protein